MIYQEKPLYAIYSHPDNKNWNMFYVIEPGRGKPAPTAKFLSSVRQDDAARALANFLNGRYSRPRQSVTAVEERPGIYEVEVIYK